MKAAAEIWMLPLAKSGHFTTRAEFVRELKSAFTKGATREAARFRIKGLCQTTPINDYWNKFQIAMNSLNWNHIAIQDEFFEEQD